MPENLQSSVRASQPCAISVIVPIKNEEENITAVYEAVRDALAQAAPDFELIFVDDGSTDRSLELIKGLAARDPRVVWLSFDRNHGQTAAWDAGFKAARGRLLATMDGDLQNDPADYPAMIGMIGPDCDIVCGVRQKRMDSVVRKISSRVGNGFRNWITGESVTDVGCSLRVFKRECVEGLKLFEGMHRFFPTLLKMEGWRFKEVPVRHHPRARGKTKYGVWNRLWRGLRDCLAVAWMRDRRLRYRIAARSANPPTTAA